MVWWNRWKPNEESTFLLEHSFRESHRPDITERSSLAMWCNTDIRRIQVWFQNRRQRLNEDVKDAAAENGTLPAFPILPPTIAPPTIAPPAIAPPAITVPMEHKPLTLTEIAIFCLATHKLFPASNMADVARNADSILRHNFQREDVLRALTEMAIRKDVMRLTDPSMSMDEKYAIAEFAFYGCVHTSLIND